jgi:2'-hydroxyisoflavone reductase
MRVLVIGGSGFIGNQLVAKLASHGHQVSSLGLTQPTTPVRALIGDRNDPLVLHEALRPDYDAVIDLVAFEPNQTTALVAASKGRSGRIIHLSTASVYSRSAPAKECDAIRHNDQPDDQSDTNGYGPRKASCERVLERAHDELGVASIMLRPVSLIGPNDPVSRENWFLKRILRGGPLIVPAPLSRQILVLHVDDLVIALMAALYCPVAAAQAYHLAIEDAPLLIGHIETIAAIAGVNMPEIREIPVEQLIARGFHLFAFPYIAMGGHLDMSAAAADLGFRPRSYAEAMTDTVGWLLAHKPLCCPAWPGRITTQSRLCGTHEWLHLDLELNPTKLERFATPSIDSVLARLTGSPSQSQEAINWSVDKLEAWSGVESVEYPLILVPECLLQNWSITTTGLHQNNSGSGGLVAIMEKAGAGQEGYWLYLQGSASTHQNYVEGYGSVYRLYTDGFAKIDNRDIKKRERLILECNTKSDVSALVLWLKKRQQEHELNVPDLEALARVHIAPSCRAAVEGNPPWFDIFSLARLLVSAGLTGSARLRLPVIPTDNASELLSGIVLFAADQEWYFADIASNRLFTVTASFAEALTT